MSNAAFLSAFVGIQLGFAALDVIERHRTADTRYGGERVRTGTVVFLFAIVLLFLAIQGVLMALAPRIETMMAAVRDWFAGQGGTPTDAAMGAGPMVVLCVVAFYLGGLFDYLVHRFFNHSRLFWWTHEYHHLPNQVFVALPGLIVRPFSVFSAIPTAFLTIVVAYALMAVLGWPLYELEPLRILVLLNTFVLTASHSCFLRRWWWPHEVLTRLGITTPMDHLVHHTVDRPGNYANLVTIWDRLLGTYRDPRDPDNRDRPLGLAYDQDFLGTITFSRLKLSPSLRRRFQVARYCNLDPDR